VTSRQGVRSALVWWLTYLEHRHAGSSIPHSRALSQDISGRSPEYNRIISGQTPIKAYFASIKSETQGRATDGRVRPLTVRIQPVPERCLEKSIAWVTRCSTQGDAYAILENFGSSKLLQGIIDVPAYNNGVCYTKWTTGKGGQLTLEKCSKPPV
jgi:hypothetical protein